MPSHKKASIESQSLCEDLLEEIRKILPTVTRNESNDTCALYVPGRNRFAYVYHRSKGGFIRCYFRGDVIVKPAFQSGIKINIRPKIEKGWDKEFPYFVEVSDHHLLPQVAQILCANAYPLSEKKKSGMNQSQPFYLPEEIPQVAATFSEGSATTISINKYERNVTARKICIEHYGCACQICKFDFYKFYGNLGEGLIHVHHLKPLAQIGEGYQVDPIKDLIPVCPNCHAVIHRKKETISVDDIKLIIQSVKTEQLHAGDG